MKIGDLGNRKKKKAKIGEGRNHTTLDTLETSTPVAPSKVCWKQWHFSEILPLGEILFEKAHVLWIIHEGAQTKAKYNFLNKPEARLWQAGSHALASAVSGST